MTNLKIPAELEAITSEWLTQALRSSGTITEATVESLDMEKIGEGQGFTCRVARFRLNYNIEEQGVPRSLVAKFSAADPHIRTTLNRFRVYEREIRFYSEISHQVELRTPHCFYSALDKATGESVLLLEDLAPALVGNNLAGCSSEEAELAIRHLAKFHATWWENPRLEDIDWMPMFDDHANKVQKLYQQLWGLFTQKFPDLLSKSRLELGTRLGKNVTNIRNRLAEPPQTIVHNDYRLDNLFFSSPEGGVPFAVIDWQAAQRGRGVLDVAYFLGFCLPSEHRRAVEMSLLKIYYSVLVENGVWGYEFDQCLHDFRLSTLQVLFRVVTASGWLDFTSERERSLVEILLQRSFAIMDDHNVRELMAK